MDKYLKNLAESLPEVIVDDGNGNKGPAKHYRELKKAFKKGGRPAVMNYCTAMKNFKRHFDSEANKKTEEKA